MGEPNWYDILEVNPKSDAATIKKAYLRACKKAHPDVNSTSTAEVRFKRIQEAYAVLSNPRERALFDQQIGERLHYDVHEHSSSSPGYGSIPPYRSPHTFRRRAFILGEAVLSRNMRWLFVGLAPIWVVGYIGLTTLSSPDPTQYDPEKMIRAGKDQSTGVWLRPTFDNLEKIGANKSLHLVPESWIGTVGGDVVSKTKKKTRERPAK